MWIAVQYADQKQHLLVTNRENLGIKAVKVQEAVGSNEIACVDCTVLQTEEFEMTDS